MISGISTLKLKFKHLLHRLWGDSENQGKGLLKRGVEAVAEALTIDLIWTILRRFGFIGAGVAAAAVYTAVTATSHLPYSVIPAKYAALTPQQEQISRIARKYGPGSGIYYVWGGTSPSGFDCSGYYTYVLRRAGVSDIPRTTGAQWNSPLGSRVDRSDLRIGDAVYFIGSDGWYGNPGHMGLYIGGGRFLEYYSSGHPARNTALSGYPGYVGAKRWINVAKVPKRDFFLSTWVAHHWKIKISGSHVDNVTFRAKATGGRFPLWKWAGIHKWAHSYNYKITGRINSYISIKLYPRAHRAASYGRQWRAVKNTARWIHRHWGVRLKSHTASGVAVYVPRRGKIFNIHVRHAIVHWAKLHGHKMKNDKHHLRIALYPLNPQTSSQ